MPFWEICFWDLFVCESPFVVQVLFFRSNNVESVVEFKILNDIVLDASLHL